MMHSESRGVDEPLPNGRLTSLTIEGFRGFNTPCRLDLDASAVLLHGSNGTGKTSVFDGIQWLLTGGLPRLTPLRLRRSDAYLRNTFTKAGAARVSGTFRLGGKVMIADRIGDGRSSSLRVKIGSKEYEGEAAQRELGISLIQGQVPLAEVLHTSGLLQQDDMRQLLHTKPDARYRQLMRLLGLEVVDAFDQYMQSVRSSARESLRVAEARLARAREELSSVADALETSLVQIDRATSATPNFQEGLASDGALEHIAYARPLQEEDLEAAAAELAVVRESVTSCLDLVPVALESDQSDLGLNVGQAEADLSSAEDALRDARRQDELARVAVAEAKAQNDLFTRLAAAAIPLLHDSDGLTPCPVCETPIQAAAVRRSLEQRSYESVSMAASQASADHARRNLLEIEASVRRLSRRLDDLREDARAADRRQGARTRLRETLLRATSLQLLRLPKLEEFLSHLGGLSNSAVTMRAGAQDLVAELETLMGLVEEWSAAVTTWTQQLSIRRLAAERNAAIPRQRAALAEAQSRVAALEEETEVARIQELRSSSLARSTTSAAGEIFRERFAALEPLMNDVYARLDPHPAFTHLSFEVESFRSKGTATASVRDEEFGLTVNPMLIFSAAQANIVALSAFLALAWAGGAGSLPFMFLDDPLQALDDVNVLGFSDLARQVRRERQLVLATHEARFASLLTRKLTGLRPGEDLIVHEFVGWSRGGPEIVTTRIDTEEGLRQPFIVA